MCTRPPVRTPRMCTRPRVRTPRMCARPRVRTPRMCNPQRMTRLPCRGTPRLAHGSGSASGGLRGRSAVAVPVVIFARGRLAAHVYLCSPARPRPLAGWTRSRVRCGVASQARPPRPSSPVCAGGAGPVRRRVGRSRVGLLQPAPGTSPHAPPLGSDRPRLMLRPAPGYLRRTASGYLGSQHKSGYRTPRSSPSTARPGRGGAAAAPPAPACAARRGPGTPRRRREKRPSTAAHRASASARRKTKRLAGTRAARLSRGTGCGQAGGVPPQFPSPPQKEDYRAAPPGARGTAPE